MVRRNEVVKVNREWLSNIAELIGYHADAMAGTKNRLTKDDETLDVTLRNIALTLKKAALKARNKS